MKITSTVRNLFVAATLLASTLLATPSQAQTYAPPSVARIPFDFSAGNSHLKAGSYSINQPLNYFVALRARSQASVTVAIPSVDLDPSARSKIVFHRYGDRYFLREIWSEGSTDHLALPESKEEKRLRKETLQASAGFQSGNVELALLTISH